MTSTALLPDPIPHGVSALRRGIADAHTALEATAVAQAMAAGTIPRPVYGQALAVLGVLHARVEPALAADPVLWPVFGRPQGRWAALQRDLAVLATPPLPASHPLALLVAQTIQDRPGLLGAAFVLEGSRGGSRFLLPRLATALGVTPQPGVGLDLHLAAGSPAAWPAVLTAIAGLDWPPADYDRAAAAAAGVMNALVPAFADIWKDPR